ncbi:MAG: response regulator [Elusimicrobiota bacterium]
MSPFSVLLVDDEVVFVNALFKRINKRKITASCAYTAEEALEYLAEKPVDIVVMDVKMPGMGGLAALREIKKRHPLVEVIMLTGHANVELAIEGMELGAFDYLTKPTDIEELVYKLQDAYKKRSLQLAKGNSGT